jgi:DNA-binding MarR family transcriptional regulator
MPQVRLMHLLLLQDCRPVGELAEEMNVRPATVTGLTDRLIRQGLIEREEATNGPRYGPVGRKESWPSTTTRLPLK